MGTHTVFAQFNEPFLDQSIGINLTLKPQYPAPNTQTEVTLDAYTITTAGSEIFWYINSTEAIDYRNQRTLLFETGPFGSVQNIRAIIVPPNGVPVPVETTIRPGVVDIIVEAKTTAPVFYRGRKLPSADSAVRVIAVPHLGQGISASSYAYEWQLDTAVLFGGPLTGGYIADITLPTFGESLLWVTVFDANGVAVGRGVTRLSTQDPELYFYENNPLRGMSRIAIGERFNLVEEETTIQAEPYFINDNESRSSAQTHQWRVNGDVVETGEANPRTITLRKTGGSGSATVRLESTNTQALFQNVKDSFEVFFE